MACQNFLRWVGLCWGNSWPQYFRNPGYRPDCNVSLQLLSSTLDVYGFPVLSLAVQSLLDNDLWPFPRRCYVQFWSGVHRELKLSASDACFLPLAIMWPKFRTWWSSLTVMWWRRLSEFHLLNKNMDYGPEVKNKLVNEPRVTNIFSKTYKSFRK